MELKVIAYAHNGHTDKFGIPRQSREESPIVTHIVFEPEYSVREALRGIEGYSHLWLIWGFSDVRRTDVRSTKAWRATVRPPKLGGNKRMGVFATRSPFRPNPIGMSSVRLLEVRRTDVRCTKDGGTKDGGTKDGGTKGEGRMELIVSGADVLDGTPIYDIKPYLSFSDSHADAKDGFAESKKDYRLAVDWSEAGIVGVGVSPDNNLGITYVSPRYNLGLSGQWVEDVSYILGQDPRPGYQDDPNREYKIDYAGYTVTFVVVDRSAKESSDGGKEQREQVVVVKNIEKC